MIQQVSSALLVTQDIKPFAEDKYDYGEITLKDWSDFGDEIWIGKIQEHTTTCSNDCSSLLELNVKEGLPYYDYIKFYKINNGQRIEKEIYSYKVEERIKHNPIEYPIYSYVCSPTGKMGVNGTAEQSCSSVETGTGTRYEDVWEEITDKDLSDGSTAYIRIVGEKKATDIIDWVITTQGESLDAWAEWGGLGIGPIIAYWTLNETSGTRYDSVGIWNSTKGNPPPSGLGLINASLKGNQTDNDVPYVGSGSVLNMSNVLGGLTEFSMSFWLNSSAKVGGNAYTSCRSYIQTENGGGANGFDFGDCSVVGYGNAMHFKINNKIQTDIIPALNNSQWHHIVITAKSGGNYNLYIDNVLRNTSDAGTFTMNNNGLLLGGSWTWAMIEGSYLDEVFVYKGTLSVAQINYLYNSGIGLTYADIVLGYITLNSPADSLETINQTILFNCSATPTAPATLVNISLWTNNTGWKLNSTVAVTGTTGSATFMKTFPVGNYNWSCSACDSDGACGKSSTNRTFELTNIQENSKTYSATAYETATERFELNITTTSNVASVNGNLIYNGTAYTSTVVNTGEHNYSLINYLNIPLASVNTDTKNLYWTIDYYDGLTSSTKTISSVTQTVKSIDFNLCNSSLNGVYINFTAYNESDSTERVMPFSFDGTFNYWLGSGTSYKNRSISGSLFNQTALCFSANEKTLYLDANIEYGDGGVQYITKDYLISNDSYTNVTTNHTLFMLDSDDSTTFILKVQDTAQNPEPNIYIHIQRYFPGTDTYTTVQITKTNDDGKTVGFYKAETVNYRHLLYDSSGTLLLQTSPGKVFAESVPYTILFTLGAIPDIPWKDLEQLTQLRSSIGYNNNTKIANFSYVDTSTSFESSRFLVSKVWYNQSNQVICNTTSSLATATITCNLANYNGTIIGHGYITRGGVETLVELDYWDMGVTGKQTFGKSGLFLAWFILLVAGSIFIYNIIAGMWIECAALILVNAIGLASFPAVFIWGAVALTIIATIIFGREGGNV